MFVGNEKKRWTPCFTFASWEKCITQKKLVKAATFFLWVYLSVILLIKNFIIFQGWGVYKVDTHFEYAYLYLVVRQKFSMAINKLYNQYIFRWCQK